MNDVAALLPLQANHGCHGASVQRQIPSRLLNQAFVTSHNN
jgi:hypothetical protein